MLYSLASKLECGAVSRILHIDCFCRYLVPHSSTRCDPGNAGFSFRSTVYMGGRCVRSAAFYQESGLAHTQAKDAAICAVRQQKWQSYFHPGMLIIRARQTEAGNMSCLKIELGTKKLPGKILFPEDTSRKLGVRRASVGPAKHKRTHASNPGGQLNQAEARCISATILASLVRFRLLSVKCSKSITGHHSQNCAHRTVSLGSWRDTLLARHDSGAMTFRGRL